LLLLGLALVVAGYPWWAWYLPWLWQPFWNRVGHVCLSAGLFCVGTGLIVRAMKAAIRRGRIGAEVHGPKGRE